MKFRLRESARTKDMSEGKKHQRGLTELRYCLCTLLKFFCEDAEGIFDDHTKYQVHHKDYNHDIHDFRNLTLCPIFDGTDRTANLMMSPNTSIHKLVPNIDSIENIEKYCDIISNYKLIDVYRSIISGKVVLVDAISLKNDLQSNIDLILMRAESEYVK